MEPIINGILISLGILLMGNVLICIANFCKKNKYDTHKPTTTPLTSIQDTDISIYKEKTRYNHLNDIAYFINQYVSTEEVRKETRKAEAYLNIALTKLYDEKIIDILAITSIKHVYKQDNVFNIVTTRPGKLIGKSATTIDKITEHLRIIYNDNTLLINLYEFGYQYTVPMFQNESWDIPE